MTAGPGIESLVSFLECAPDPAIVSDDHDRIVVVNHSAESLFGYQRLELVGRPVHELLPTLVPPIQPTVGDETTVVAHHRDGHTMRLTVSFRSVPIDQLRLTAAYFRPTAEQGGSEPALWPLLEALPTAAFLFEPSGRLLRANAAGAATLGRPPAELIGKGPSEFGLPAAAGRAWLDALHDSTISGTPHRFGVALESGGATHWSSGTAVRCPVAPGEPGAVLVVLQDVTALHRARADLEAASLRFRRLTEGIQDLISQHTANGTFLYASPAATTLLQRAPESLSGLSLADLVHDEDRARVGATLAKAAINASESDRLTTFRLLRPDGSFIWCEMAAHPTSAATGSTVTCVIRDITERIRSEEILRAASRMEATATLAAGVAHDFNNLMTSILGNAELLLADPTFPDGPSRLTQIADLATRGGALAQQLLAYARGGKYQAQAVSLNDLVGQALHLQKHAMPPRVQLEADLTPEPLAIEADPVQIGQVVTNLCINASEAIPGVGRLTVRTRAVVVTESDTAGKPGLKPGPAALLQVSDTGTGIEPTILPRIFEPFFSTKFQGRGLGLAAAYGIVKNHRGYIGVESTLGKGTTFSIYLPAVVAAPARPPEPVEPFPRGHETLLLVDDDDAVVDVTRSILERLGYTVLVARHGIEAVEIARTHQGPLDLAILDLGMPLAGGAESYPFLKAARPEIRVMISSGYEMNEVVQGLLSAGADAFLQKPYRVSALARGLRQVLDHRVQGVRLSD